MDIGDDFVMETRQLEKFEYGLMQYLTRELIGDFANPPRIDISQDVWLADMLVLRLRQEIAGEHLERAEWQYPANWKEAVKERFAPDWFKARWPVKHTMVRVDVRALYPRMAFPKEGHLNVSRLVCNEH